MVLDVPQALSPIEQRRSRVRRVRVGHRRRQGCLLSWGLSLRASMRRENEGTSSPHRCGSSRSFDSRQSSSSCYTPNELKVGMDVDAIYLYA